jgi:hypothetical protein
MTIRIAIRVGLLGLGLTSIACGAKTMIGDVSDASAPNLQAVGTMGHTCRPPQFAGDQAFTFPAGVEGVWAGYTEQFGLGISSDAIRLTLDHAADGTSQIRVVYGTLPAPPPATSATDFYPSDASAGNASLPIEGFAYLGHNVHWDAFGAQWRLRFMIDLAEPFAGWCRLQSSYAASGPGLVPYSCVPNTGGYVATDPNDCAITDGSGHPVATFPCSQVEMCTGLICACDQCGCDMPGIDYDGIPSGPGPSSYDVLFDPAGASASGGGIHLIPAATP